MTRVRGLATVVLALVALLAVVLQTSAFSHVAVRGVVPDLALLVVVAGALARGPRYGCLLGFGVGLVLDLAPPADHLAGRWALALVVVGYLAGRASEENPGLTRSATMGVVAVSSLVGTSVYAFSGLLLHDPVVAVAPMLATILVALVWDVLVGALLVPPLVALQERLEPARIAY